MRVSLYVMIGILIVLSLMIIFMVIPSEVKQSEYKSTPKYIEGQETMRDNRSFAPEGCREGMHSANTCQILGVLSQQQEQLDRIELELKK